MVLTEASPTRLTFSSRSSLRSTLVAAIAFSLMGALPLAGPGAVTLGRALMSAMLLLVATVLLLQSRAPHRTLSIALDERTLVVDGERIPLSAVRCLALTTGGSTKREALRSRFRVELVLEDGRRITLLDRSDPARVLRELRTIDRALHLPIRAGWGLPEDAEPWRTDAAPRGLTWHGVESIRAAPRDGQLGAAACVLVGAVVIGCLIALMHGARMQRGEATSLLSYALSSITLLVLLLLGTFLASQRVVVSATASALLIERRAFGRASSRVEIPLATIAGAHAVGVTPAEPSSVLVWTREDVHGIPLTSEASRSVLAALSRPQGTRSVPGAQTRS